MDLFLFDPCLQLLTTVLVTGSAVTGTGWSFKNATARAEAMKLNDNQLDAWLREQAPDTGCYINESDADQPDHQQAFWGDHYSRLLSIKRRLDPNGVFWCTVCVGAEDWTLESSGELCKNS